MKRTKDEKRRKGGKDRVNNERREEERRGWDVRKTKIEGEEREEV